MITAELGIFLGLTLVILLFSSVIVMVPNPIYAALSLAVTMVALGFMYFLLGAYFIAGVQLIVYAGAVMVLFVMVVMLFDLKKELRPFSGGIVGTVLKSVSAIGFLALVIFVTKAVVSKQVFVGADRVLGEADSVRALAGLLFTKYVFAFEALGLLLLLIAVGVVAVARSKGGTHERS